MTDEFRDFDPEDAWDDDDPLDHKLTVLERVIDSVRQEKRDGHTERTEFRRKDALRLCGKLEHATVNEERQRSHDAARLAEIRDALEQL